MHLDALKLAESIRERVGELALEQAEFRDDNLRKEASLLWGGAPELGGLVGDPWVEGAFPAQSSGMTLRDLSERGVIDRGLVAQLEATGAMPEERRLHTHQRDALELVHQARLRGERPGLVVTAGTGAGKTESFLLPMLDELWRTPRQHGQGVSAVLLYPMNALVIDQVSRLSSWLAGQSRISFFHFTSETPEDDKAASLAGIEPRALPYFRTRKQARGLEDDAGRPLDGGGGRNPDVVVTNYSMLEYMLCRPQDGVFFGKNLSVVVLDEAHLYNGTLAAEIALLLRRLLERCGRRPEEILFLAASATLGSGTDEEIREQLRDFGASLSSKNASQIHAIMGQVCPPAFEGEAIDDRAKALEALDQRWVEVDTLEQGADGQPRLREDPVGCEQLGSLMEHLLGQVAKAPEEAMPAPLLHRQLPRAGVLRQAAALLFEKRRVPLKTLASHLWGSLGTEPQRQLATVRLLTLGASARRSVGDLPLLPHRIHIPVRGSEGLSVCLNPSCSAPSRLPARGPLLGGHREICPFCRAVALPLLRCHACGESVLVSRDLNVPDDPWGADGPGDRVRGWVHPHAPTRPLCFALKAPSSEGPGALKIDPESGEIEGEHPVAMLQPVAAWQEAPCCPACREPLTLPSDAEQDEPPPLRPYQTGAPLTTLLIAETVLPALPPLSSSNRYFLPAEGRRLLAFSDSRRSAARLGPQLTDSHGRRVFQAALARFLSSGTSAEDLELLEVELALYEKQLSKNPSNATVKQKLASARQALAAARLGHTIDSLPLVMANDPDTAGRLAQLLDLDAADLQEAPWLQEQWEGNRDRILSHESLLSLLGREVARRGTGQRTLEGQGLVELLYPGLEKLQAPDSLLAVLPGEARKALSSLWPTLMALLCDTLRADGAITLGNDKRDKAYSFGESWLGRWASEEVAGWQTTAFLGMTTRQHRRAFASGVLMRLGVSAELADEISQRLLREAFGQLAKSGFAWVEVEAHKQVDPDQVVRALRLRLEKLVLRRPPRLWQSLTSGKIWSRVVPEIDGKGVAPEAGCSDMREVRPEDLDGDPRVGRGRRELMGTAEDASGGRTETPREIFELALWAEEHSAQRSPRENRRLQGLFEAGARNVLSASTTLEVGIDIGGLNGVLMANAPPGKASYLQRSGRAGRRTDGSSAVLVFCHPRPFDREVFLRFDQYLGRALRRPRVIFERERIARRHAHAWLLGDFFRTVYGLEPTGAMQAFGRMGAFLGLEMPLWWDPKSLFKPALPEPMSRPLHREFCLHLRRLAQANTPKLSEALAFLLEGTPAAASLRDIPSFLSSVETAFQQAIDSFQQDLLDLRALYEAIPNRPGPSQMRRERAMARALHKQLGTLATTTVIEALSDRQFLPKFGFPVGLHRLKVMVPDDDLPGRLREEDSIRLERASLLAMAEYVPGSRVLVGGKVVTSRGVLRHFTSNDANDTLGQRGYLITCPQRHTSYSISSAPSQCHFCGQPPSAPPSHLLLPRHGFVSAGWDPPVRGLDVRPVGNIEQVSISFGENSSGEYKVSALGGVQGLEVRYREDGEILVFNRGKYRHGFALCTRCGYADSEHKPSAQASGANLLPSKFERHPPVTSDDRDESCWKYGEVSVLRHHILAARQLTDIALIRFPSRTEASAAFAETLGRALQIAGARLLEVDTRELGVLVVPQGISYQVALYDNIPGGVGHVRELIDQGVSWLREAHRVLFVDEAHHQRCLTACLDCIMTFDAQQAASRGLLNRSLVFPVLGSWLG